MTCQTRIFISPFSASKLKNGLQLSLANLTTVMTYTIPEGFATG